MSKINDLMNKYKPTAVKSALDETAGNNTPDTRPLVRDIWAPYKKLDTIMSGLRMKLKKAAPDEKEAIKSEITSLEGRMKKLQREIYAKETAATSELTEIQTREKDYYTQLLSKWNTEQVIQFIFDCWRYKQVPSLGVAKRFQNNNFTWLKNKETAGINGPTKGGKYKQYAKELKEMGIILTTDSSDYIARKVGARKDEGYFTDDLEDAYVTGKNMAKEEKAVAKKRSEKAFTGHLADLQEKFK